jgi:hypothetical protein
MHTDIGQKAATLLKNHNELTALIQSDSFNQIDEDTKLRLMILHEEVDASMNTINKQLDTLDCKIADLLCSLRL